MLYGEGEGRVIGALSALAGRDGPRMGRLTVSGGRCRNFLIVRHAAVYESGRGEIALGAGEEVWWVGWVWSFGDV